ncbi:MAG: hypothetical protein GY867_04110 [bacterium]|nr:hypothetical protein [bacterium]
MKSGRPLLSLVLTGVLLVFGSMLPAQTATDSAGSAAVPFYDVPINPDSYLIRPGEQLEIVFINVQLPSLSLTVDAESRIVHQKLGIFDLAGKTLSETRQALLAPLARLFNADQIDISIRAIYPVSIQVSGAVVRPGWYVGYTSQRVSDIIDSAGGVLPEGSTRGIQFVRNGETIPVDLDRALRLGDRNLNPNLYAGNRIHVSDASEHAVHVMGEVNEPRSIELLPGDDLDLLLSLAGEALPWGDPSSAFVVGDSSRDLKTADGVRPGDFIVVPRQAGRTEDKDCTVLGAIANPGRYSWSRGTKIGDLLDAAGGLTDNGNVERIVVFRRALDDLSGLALRERYPLPLGGGEQSVSLVLEPSDSVVVAVRVGYVRVLGRVSTPGVYPFEPRQNVGYYLSLAGGVERGLDNYQMWFRDPLSNLSRPAEKSDAVFDGLEIIVRQQELGQ